VLDLARLGKPPNFVTVANVEPVSVVGAEGGELTIGRTVQPLRGRAGRQVEPEHDIHIGVALEPGVKTPGGSAAYDGPAGLVHGPIACVATGAPLQEPRIKMAISPSPRIVPVKRPGH